MHKRMEVELQGSIVDADTGNVWQWLGEKQKLEGISEKKHDFYYKIWKYALMETELDVHQYIKNVCEKKSL
jgi:hypothetical protein